MLARQAGLTKTYNLVFDPAVHDEDIAELRRIHEAIDEATVTAYGWDDLSTARPRLPPRRPRPALHDRPGAQREILDRLLELNHERYAEEVAKGLHDKKKARTAQDVEEVRRRGPVLMPPSPRRCEIRLREMRQRFSPRPALRVDPRGRDELRQPVADAADPLRAVDLPVVRPGTASPGSRASSRRRTPRARCGGTSHHDAGRSQPGCAQPRSRAATARRSPSGIVRVARPTSSGCPALFRTTGTTAASQHSIRSDSGESVPPKSSARGPGPVLQVLQPDQHVHVRAVSAALGHRRRGRVVQHVPAHVGECLGLPLAGGAVVVAGQRLRLRVDHGGDGVEHRSVVEPALQLSAAGGGAGQEQLVDLRRWPVVRLGAVLVQRLDQRECPRCAARTVCSRRSSPRSAPRPRPTARG